MCVSSSSAYQIMQRWYIHNSKTTTIVSGDDDEKQEVSLKSDPTAKRPTQKCDPYGLHGESLSYGQCVEWMSTLGGGWMLLETTTENSSDGIFAPIVDDLPHKDVGRKQDNGTSDVISPKFLQKQYYHQTFHEASQFLSHVSLVATNINHYPYLSMERILVNDINNIHHYGDKITSAAASSSDNLGVPKRKKRKIKGWIFCSTIRCSTYRPSTTTANNREKKETSDDFPHNDKGLTYHDFHLAMTIDVEANREDIKRLVLTQSRGRK